MAKYDLVTVKLWGMVVGYLINDGKRYLFEYEPEFATSGLEISPFKMKLGTDVYLFPELTRMEGFNGLPGVFADSLPDRFGQKVLAKYFEKLGIPEQDVPLFAKLLYIGKRGMGALEYEPDQFPKMSSETDLEITNLWKRSKKILEGKIETSTDQIFRYAGTAGGARAKAIILYDPITKNIKNPFLENAPKEFESWIIKFDGVEKSKTQPYERLEYIYNKMAILAGLNVPQIDYVEENGRFHFLVKRFDRKGEEKIHMATLAGLLHIDLYDQRSVAYDVLLKTTRTLTNDAAQVEEAFARAVFNIMTQNQDDHVKNHSFLMDKSGKWSLSPVYDILYTPRVNKWFDGGQQMTINGKSENINRSDLELMGKSWGILRPGEIIDRVLSAINEKEFMILTKEFGLHKLFPEITNIVASVIKGRSGLLVKESGYGWKGNDTPVNEINPVNDNNENSDNTGRRCKSGNACANPKKNVTVRRKSGYCWECHKNLNKP